MEIYIFSYLSMQTPHVAARTPDAGRSKHLAQQMSHQKTLKALGSYRSAFWVSVFKFPFRNKSLVFLFGVCLGLQYRV